jgi:hypothetical protein
LLRIKMPLLRIEMSLLRIEMSFTIMLVRRPTQAQVFIFINAPSFSRDGAGHQA